MTMIRDYLMVGVPVGLMVALVYGLTWTLRGWQGTQDLTVALIPLGVILALHWVIRRRGCFGR